MNNTPRRAQLSVDDLATGIRARNRALLARAVTLIESTNPQHKNQAQALLQMLLADTGKSIRIGISGVPGVGKSTFIENFGLRLVTAGHRVAVLAVDPTSERTGGSILGDKTRMQNLSASPSAFIRPSPTSGTLGGVNQVTRETMLLCEAAGFDVIIVETVGVGQSETLVATMIDFFLLLMLPGAGDDLQGIKRGVMEVADMVVVNKCDGGNKQRAIAARNDYTHAIRMLSSVNTDWQPPVMTCSALHDHGLAEIWSEIERHNALSQANGRFHKNRSNQLLHWLKSTVEYSLLDHFYASPEVAAQLDQIREQVTSRQLTPPAASEKLIGLFHASTHAD